MSPARTPRNSDVSAPLPEEESAKETERGIEQQSRRKMEGGSPELSRGLCSGRECQISQNVVAVTVQMEPAFGSGVTENLEGSCCVDVMRGRSPAGLSGRVSGGKGTGPSRGYSEMLALK